MQTDTLKVLRAWPGQPNTRTSALQIGDRFLLLPARQLAILECLYENLGVVVPYARLCAILGLSSDKGKDRHLLRQYINHNSATLEANHLPYVITVAHEVGYALCRVAPQALNG